MVKIPIKGQDPYKDREKISTMKHICSRCLVNPACLFKYILIYKMHYSFFGCKAKKKKKTQKNDKMFIKKQLF